MNPPPSDLEARLAGLPVDRTSLFAAARAVLEHSHSPYSKVRVGAALVDARGQVFVGCNVENASYGLTICAERSAIGRAVVEKADQLLAVAIVTNRPRALMPCGACRQVLMEFAPDLLVLCEGADGEVVERSLSDLLPDAFEPKDLD